MKIYEWIVMDIASGIILEEDSFEYEGPLTLCGGGGDVPDTSAAIIQGAQIQAESIERGREEYLQPSTEAAIKLQYPWGKAGKEALGRYSQLMGLGPETWREPGSYALQDYQGYYPPNQIPGQAPMGPPATSPYAAAPGEMPSFMYPGMEEASPQALLESTPGYQFQLDQARKQLERSQAARGMLESGQTLQGIVDYSQNIASNYYQNYLNQLAGLSGTGQTSTAQMGAGLMAGGQQMTQATAGAGAALGTGYQQAAAARQQAAMANRTNWGGILGGIGSIAGAGAAIFSDERLKENVKPFNALAQIDKLQPKKYRYKGESENRAGFIAQDVEKVIPEAVVTHSSGYKMLDPLAVNALIVEAVKEQNKEIKKLKRRKSYA